MSKVKDRVVTWEAWKLVCEYSITGTCRDDDKKCSPRNCPRWQSFPFEKTDDQLPELDEIANSISSTLEEHTPTMIGDIMATVKEVLKR